MNKLEQRYAAQLEMQRLAGEILAWDYEAKTFELAFKCTHTTDFQVITLERKAEYHETKCPDIRLKNGKIKRGEYVHPETWIKLKITARMYPQFKFVLVKWDNQKGWTFKEIPK